MGKVMAFAFCAMFGMTVNAFAAGSDSIMVKVKILSSISVDIAESEIDLGSVNIGSTTMSSSGITVTNTGSGVPETYSLSLSNPSGWTASSSSAGANTFVLNAAFASTADAAAWNAVNHAISTIAAAASSTKFAGDQNGAGVPAGAARTLWFQFAAPTSTDIITEQGIAVTITAQAA